MSEKVLPVKHLSARVPWHDNKWNGTVCNNPIDNSFCRILSRIDSTKNPDTEDKLCNQNIDDNNQVPCVNEKGTFLSPHGYIRKSEHSWVGINNLFSEFKPCYIQHKPCSFNAVPFLWMMKNQASEDPSHFSEIADRYELDYNTELEEEIDQKLGFTGNNWVQHQHNQKVLLDAFFGCLKPYSSLIFFYSKHTPLSEPKQRVIVGVAKVASIGSILDYNYPPDYNGHKSYVWDRIISHTITTKNPEGFLLPYHDLLDYQNKNKIEIDLKEYAVVAPDFWQFSYASELVEHDTAIDSLFAITENLKKIQKLIGKSFEKELQWIDTEVSKIWDMRGAFPGMGPILSAIKISNGNTIAWEIEKYIQNKDGDLLKTNPWLIFEESILTPTKYFKEKGKALFNKTTQTLWKYLSPKKIDFIKLLSRCQLNNEQAIYIISNLITFAEKTSFLIENLYLLYEKSRFAIDGLSFNQIDKALLPAEQIQNAFPLDEKSIIQDKLDNRRLRALSISILEQAASEGHSLLPFAEFLSRILGKRLETPFPITDEVLSGLLRDDFVKQEIISIWDDDEENPLFIKLRRLQIIKETILEKIDIKEVLSSPYNIKKNWLKLVNDYPHFKQIDEKKKPDKYEILARKEKAEALNILCNYKVSVLIGPAGSGKTTLLDIFQSIPEINKGGVLKLAPTGKARIKLGSDAKTIAQYLYPDRYNAETGCYFCNPDAAKDSSATNIIIDEASMITEDQLAALFDKLGYIERIIFVGDYRQLPPIGTGRPFVDVINRLKPISFNQGSFVSPAYAELKQILRQSTQEKKRIDIKERLDIIISRCFSDDIDKFDLETFREVSSEGFKNDFIRLEKWYDTKDFRVLFDRVLREELKLSEEEPEKDFNKKIGAVDHNGYQYFNYDYSENEIEKWQIITPNNGYAHGVKEVNKFIQTNYRKTFIELAINAKQEGQKFPNPRRIAKPKGADNIVYGDKVINLKNTNWRANRWIKPQEKKKDALNYIANGEIGVITGHFKSQKEISSKKSGEPQIEITFSTQPGYSYVYWPNEIDEEGQYPIDLAYAITIHKSQGSGFKIVFLILPASGLVLSRELLYTALTRQEEKIIILHQGEFREFIRYSSPLASSTARRFTDLFVLPTIKQIENKYYDPKYINISERGEKMISKSEVIIANCLNKYKTKISYAYEDKLKLASYEKVIKPDFTIQNLKNGKVFYWEHCGMMTQEYYREKWLKKLESYRLDGFVNYEKAKSIDRKILIVTEDNVLGGVDSQRFDEIVKKFIIGK